MSYELESTVQRYGGSAILSDTAVNNESFAHEQHCLPHKKFIDRS